MEKHLEIFKYIEELYKGDVTDQEILDFAEKNTAKLEAWKEAFKGYLLRDVLDVIDEYFAYKNNRTPPRIAQIKSLLNANNIHDEREIQTKKAESITPSLAFQYVNQDEEDGNMRWLVPDYINVERLIRQDRWYFVQNIYHPTLDEFHRCLEYYCEDLTGKKQRFYSRNDILQMTDEQQQALLEESRETMRNFKPWRLN